MTIRELLKQTTAQLVEIGKEDRAAYELLRDIMRYHSYELYDRLEENVQTDVVERFEKAIDHYIKGIPLQHLLGYEMFFGREIIVNENALIPRYETEELVEHLLYHIDDYFENYEQITVADIGTGSGAIAVTLDLEEPRTKVYATDISVEALSVAKDNNRKFDAGVTFFKGDLLQPLIENNIKVDILVSNPPYIPNDEVLEDSVKNYEPGLALFGGEEGLDYYRLIFRDAKKVLNDRALLAFEIGHNQKNAIVKEVKTCFEGSEYEVIKDMNGKDRMLFIYQNIKR